MNQAAEYAVRAAVFLARQPAHRATAGQVARALGLPRNYLSKVMYAMAQAGLLESTRGPHGGFQLNQPGAQMTLERVTAPFRHEEAHGPWYRGMSDQMSSFLKQTTLQMLIDAEPIPGGSYVDQRRAQ